jgi:hypothetical protein
VKAAAKISDASDGGDPLDPLDLDPASEPWLDDPQYGGMSDLAARRSWEAAQAGKARQHFNEPSAE